MTREEARNKARAIVGQMTLEEKAGQLLFNAPAIPRLHIQAYNWWNEALHGVARADVATVFPQAIGLAATFDPDSLSEVADIVATEARIKYYAGADADGHDIYKGLTFWSPNINIFRDPRWGRGQETYGEDPFLTATLGCRFVRGLQGDGAFLKAAACAKHFAVHSGPEKLRHVFNAECSLKDLWETYLPAFQRLVCDAHVEGVMGAYNRTNGELCCAHSYLMDEVLFGQWGFEGYFVSDCGAVCDFHLTHKVTASGPESAALALNHGCNINCGNAYENIKKAVADGLVTESVINENLIKAYTTRCLLGEFEVQEPYSDLPFTQLDCPAFAATNREIARRSLVLLKNDGTLPLQKDTLKTLAVIGPNAASTDALVGNYNGSASEYITVLDGMRRALPDTRILYSVGCHPLHCYKNDCSGTDNHQSAAVTTAKNADAVVLCVGLNAGIEGEEFPDENDYCDHGDRTCVTLPQVQLDLIDAVLDANDKVILIIMAGSPVDIGEARTARLCAVVDAWYPGAQGGAAVAELLLGAFSPSGRLPLTFPKNETVLPDICDYSMDGRTYRFANEAPAYPFGFGLGYTKIRYSSCRLLSYDRAGHAVLTGTVQNDGNMEARTVTQIYARYTDSRVRTPHYQLCGLSALVLQPGECRTVQWEIDTAWVKAVGNDGVRMEPDGDITLYIGDHQPDAQSCALAGTEPCAVAVQKGGRALL